MGKNKICVYAICKNEEKFVERWMDSVSEADLVVVVDTGSTDATVKKLRERGAIVYEEGFDPWRFDTARNAAMDHIPEDMDICVAVDLDETFEAGWAEALDKGWKPEYTRITYWFVWSHNSDGGNGKKSIKEKIHCRHGFRWVHPVHEVLEYDGVEVTAMINSIILHHYPDSAKSRGQYLPLLELSVEENPEDDRAMFWLGREYFFYKKYDSAINALERYLKLPTAIWNEERGAASCFISKAYAGKKDIANTKIWLFKAVGECSTTREPWLEMAKFGYSQKDWPLTFFAVEMGLNIKECTNSYLVDSSAWGYAFYDLGAISCYYLGMFEKALIYADKALEILPEDERIKQNFELIRAKCNSRGGK